jgi:hypothetical protein
LNIALWLAVPPRNVTHVLPVLRRTVDPISVTSDRIADTAGK